MPTYDYLCNTCGEKFEHFQSMSSPPLKQRPKCEKDDCNIRRIVSGGTGLIFKGSGFYLTDYGKTKSEKSESEKNTKKEKKKKNISKKDKTRKTSK